MSVLESSCATSCNFEGLKSSLNGGLICSDWLLYPPCGNHSRSFQRTRAVKFKRTIRVSISQPRFCLKNLKNFIFKLRKECHPVRMTCRAQSTIFILNAIALTLGINGRIAQAQQYEYEEILASDGSHYDEFGFSVSVTGGVAVIGARGDDDNGNDSGSAYVYHFDNVAKSWVQKQKLVPSDGEACAFYGNSVSVSNGVAAIGSLGDNENGSDSGSVYVYDFDSVTKSWLQKQKLSASDADSDDSFGCSVSVSGDVMVIGAFHDDDNGPNSGSAYAFRFDPLSNSWTEEQKLLPSDGAADDEFGYSVSLSDHVIVIGARYDDDNGIQSGSAYVFRFDSLSNRWVEEQKLLPSDGDMGDTFGYSVSLSGNLAIVGAHLNNDIGLDSGSAYVFRFDALANSWSEEQKLLPSDGMALDWFGLAVDLSDEKAVIGARGNDDNGPNSGSAYVFRFSALNNIWVEENKLLPSDNTGGDYFGNSVSVSSSVAMVGAWKDSDNGQEAGSVYVFDVADPFLLSSTSPLQSGQTGWFHATDGKAFEQTWLIYSLLGGSCAEYYPPLNVIFGVCNPLSQAGNPLQAGLTDANGSILWSLTIPTVGSTTPVWFQAVQRNNITPVLSTTMEP